MLDIKTCVSHVQQQIFVLFGSNYIILTAVLILSFFMQHYFCDSSGCSDRDVCGSALVAVAISTADLIDAAVTAAVAGAMADCGRCFKSQDFSCGGSVCCGNGVSGLLAVATLAPVAASAVEATSAVCRRRQRLRRLWHQLWKQRQQSVGGGVAGSCGGVSGGSGVSGWSATAMVSAAVALAEAFALVVDAAVVGTMAV
jgi:hypothetical protein